MSKAKPKGKRGTTLETVEQAKWKIEGPTRMSDSAIHALALLAIDLGEAEEREQQQSESETTKGKSK